jgi:hypothetical protein
MLSKRDASAVEAADDAQRLEHRNQVRRNSFRLGSLGRRVDWGGEVRARWS